LSSIRSYNQKSSHTQPRQQKPPQTPNNRRRMVLIGEKVTPVKNGTSMKYTNNVNTQRPAQEDSGVDSVTDYPINDECPVFELIFDPDLNAYYHPETHEYFKVAAGGY
jgi:hypothetical protein